ncbi:uncharacterized protein LOC110978264 [Acanthaster planci]|uniref:Uncharacterized protein LOC110978264 n=1 Tax=Acanthaster planci TaxID=133434 RepID=A0A8B7Y8B3_ACAPL|nr:uncharacterized protein LOC110978264 [Acanthaster planci]XP_022088798.1 uncharacterized protein LOC110978264 [Acanthaster planci]XP_022088799.1 uncharacterized protein LOC110978264 [Acanthaster planci]
MRLSLVVLMAMTLAVTMTCAFDLNPTLLKTVTSVVNSLANEEGQVTVAGRVIKYKAKGRVHSFKEPWVYDGTAWDISSGISEKAKHYKSKQGAIEHAMLKLLERLKRDGIMKDEL